MPLSTDEDALYFLISKRLRDERERVGLTQDLLAKKGRVSKRTQGNYEAGERMPDAEYLCRISDRIDVLYVLTGERAGAALSGDELQLLELFRKAPLAVKAAAVGALKGGTSNAVGISIGGRVEGQVVQGDLHQRDVTIAPKGRVKREK